MRLLPSSLAAVLTAAALPAQHQLFQFDGVGQHGFAVASGDVDGDGRDDAIVGAPLAPRVVTTPGLVRIYSGADGHVLRTVFGQQDLDRFGCAVAVAGDVDGDGRLDVVVGADGADPAGSDSGTAYVISGATGTFLYVWPGTAPGDRFGAAVGPAGDFDVDGFDDVVVGAPGVDAAGADSGRVSVLSGRDGHELYVFDGLAAGDAFGAAVHGARDVDDDGFPDIVVGAPQPFGMAPGYAQVLSSFDGSVLHVQNGTAGGDRFGARVGLLGDLDGDLFDEFVVTAPNAAAGAGEVWVFDGANGSVVWSAAGSAPLEHFGAALAVGSDVDADGIADVAVCVSGAMPSRVQVLSGNGGALLRTVVADPSEAGFGAALALGDLDGDGLADAITGAPLTLNEFGRARALDLDFAGTPSIERVHGAACPGSGGRLPRIGARGRARVGDVLVITLRGATPNNPAVTLFLGDATALPLGVLGLPGCTLYSNPWAPFAIGSDQYGLVRISIPLTLDPGAIGVPFEAQWVVPDIGAPYSLPIVLSDALSVRVGG